MPGKWRPVGERQRPLRHGDIAKWAAAAGLSSGSLHSMMAGKRRVGEENAARLAAVSQSAIGQRVSRRDLVRGTHRVFFTFVEDLV